MDRLRLRAGEDFLKARIASKRVPFPSCPQIGKGDAVIGVIDSKRSCERTFDFRDGVVGFPGPREDQSLKSLCDGALDHVPSDGFQLYRAPAFAKSIVFSPHECVKQSELVAGGAIWFFSRQLAARSTNATPTTPVAPTAAASRVPDKGKDQHYNGGC